MLVVGSHCFPYPLALYSNFWEAVILNAIFSQRCNVIEWMVAVPKLMYYFLSGTGGLLRMPYRRSSFPASCAPRFSVYAICISLCCAMICSSWAMLTPAAGVAAAYAPGLAGAVYTQTGSAIMKQYFSSGMMHARYPYCCPSAKWGRLQEWWMPHQVCSWECRWIWELWSPWSLLWHLFGRQVFCMLHFCKFLMTSLLLRFWRGRMIDVKIVKIS